ncbi:MAG: sigma-70 family RNA polymerase sigma factor [Gemmatimonadota bacterium]|jgi:RNA polymerase sigma factor (TIGR02999 family)|nr:sigma-70 family RNA polymerase sigma factor [Gemmatimonadota bacterium]
MHRPGEVTQLLQKLTHGGRDAVDQLFPLVYGELRGIAHQRLRNEPAGHTLDTGALVHEAYLKLADQERVDWQNRAHFFAVAARAMRRILIDYAVARKAQKRGGARHQVPLDEAMLVAEERSDELLALQNALVKLERVDERLVRTVECRYFAGMSIEETAAALGISPATVKRDWTVARAWLHRELSG